VFRGILIHGRLFVVSLRWARQLALNDNTQRRQISMALAFLLEFPGVTQEQYDQVIEKLQLGGKTYQGGIFHVAGPMEGGWRVVDVWESQEAFDRFFQAKLGQALQEVGVAPPQPKVWPVHNILRP